MTVQRPTPDPRAAVDTILGQAGLPIEADEYERLVRNYPVYRAQVDALRIPEARYALPADVYSVLERQ